MNAHVTPPPSDLPVAPEDFPLFEDGIYFGMDHDEYRSDPALGSTDMKKLSVNPSDYWWNSAFNTYREEQKDRPALIIGTALHTYVLDGEEAFFAAYAPTDLSGNTREAKAARKEIEDAGKTPLKRADFDRILVSGQMIRRNPYLGPGFEGGEREVSIFWTALGIRRKARVDYLKPLANIDLKSIANLRDLPFPKACINAIGNFRYDVQAAHYLEARLVLRQLVAAGKVFGQHDPEWLRACVEPETYAHVLIFSQKENAPLTHGITLSLDNPILDAGRASIERAEANWRRCVETFGFDTPWIEAAPPTELDMSELPGWWANY